MPAHPPARDGAAPLEWLRLHLATLCRPELPDLLFDRFGSWEAVLDATAPAAKEPVGPRPGAGGAPGAPDAAGAAAAAGAEDEARAPGPRVLRRLRDPAWRARAAREAGLCAARGAALRVRSSPDWPVLLSGLPQAPLALFVRGVIEPCDARAVAVVGTRSPSAYGLRQARRLATGLARHGLTIVSGLARGIDVEAHRAALAAGGRTIAVLGSGLGRIYPAEHEGAARAIIESGRGAVVSELPWELGPRRHHFPLRNRILSGLALGVVVVEAGLKSGSLLTVDWALRQGRGVFAVPGRVDDPLARGCLELIQSGAWPAIGPDDVAQALLGSGVLGPQDGEAAEIESADPARWRQASGIDGLDAVFRERDAWHPDALCERLGVAPAALARALSRLELAGLIELQDGAGWATRGD